MRRLLKKSLLNGLIRTFLTIVFAVFSKFKSYERSVKEDGKIKKAIKYLRNTNSIKDVDKKTEKTTEYEQEEVETVEENSSEESDDGEEEADDENGEDELDNDEEQASDDEKTSELDEPNEIIVDVSIPYKKGLQKNSDEVKTESPKNKLFRFKTVFLFVFLIISYVCLNNYLIMFFYYKSAKISTSSSIVKSTNSFIWFSWLNFNEYRNRPDFDLDSIESSEDKFKTFIDPLDIEFISNKIQFYDNRQRPVLTESYFDEDNYFNEIERLKNRTVDFQYNNEMKRKLNHRECMLPKLNPYDREIMQFVKKEEDIKCNPKKNWIYIENGTLRVSKVAIKKHGPIVCAYIPLYRGNNDFTVYEGNRIFPVMDRMPLITDFFKIDCRSKDGAIYSNIHSGIAYESSLHMRHMWNPLPKKALGYNVLMFGFDSVSRMSWIRMLPKSYEYMLKLGFVVLKGYNIVGDGTPQALLPILTGKKETELPEARRGFANANYVDSFPWIWRDYKNSGYVTQWAEDMQSIGTFQLRMLGFRKQPVDHYMRVFYLEAERYYSRFRRLCLGSISRHRNMFNWVKEFFLIYDGKPKFSFIFHSEASHNYNNPLSLLDDDLKDFLVYLKQSGIMDNTILLFMSDHGMRISDLRQYSQGKLEERLPFFSILMPKSFQENYPKEMRNLRLNARKLTTPFDIHETLKHFLHFENSSDSESNDSNKSEEKNERMPRGISLLKKIPVNRNCEDAQIEAHWCSCLNWIDINITQATKNDVHELPLEQPLDNQKNFSFENLEKMEDGFSLLQNQSLTNLTESLFLVKQKVDFTQLTHIGVNLRYIAKSVIKIANRAVGFINSLIDNELSLYCYKLRLYSIQKLSKLDLNRKLLAFKMSKDIHGREALFEDLNVNDNNASNLLEEFSMKKATLNYLMLSSNKTSNMTEKFNNMSRDSIYQIIFTTWPGNATFELSFRFNRFTGELRFNRNEISRINSYNSTSNCMVNKRPDLRQYCYCKYT